MFLAIIQPNIILYYGVNICNKHLHLECVSSFIHSVFELYQM